MSRINARSAIIGAGFGLVLFEVLLAATPGTAGILDATWTAPTTNADGSALTDLGWYQIYYGTLSSPCPGSSSALVVSPTSSPGPNQTMSFRLSGLTVGTVYNVAVTAVDAGGNESACSSVASAAARADFAVNPSGAVNFGSVNIGSYAEQTFTVSNTGGGTVSGAASVAAPFSITSGSPFLLNGAGTSQAVSVRFTPTTTSTVSVSLNFTTAGGAVVDVVSGTGSGATPPVISNVSLAVTSSGATVGWKTNKAGDTQVEYGLTQSYGNLTPLSTTLVTSHSQTIGSLMPNTWYHLRIRSRDAVGNLAVSGDVKFKTHNH